MFKKDIECVGGIHERYEAFMRHCQDCVKRLLFLFVINLGQCKITAHSGDGHSNVCTLLCFLTRHLMTIMLCLSEQFFLSFYQLSLYLIEAFVLVGTEKDSKISNKQNKIKSSFKHRSTPTITCQTL